MKAKFRKPISNRAMCLFVFLLLFWAVPLTAICSETKGTPEIITNKSALIKDKGDYGILIEGRQYRVDESTIILDPLGKEIPLCDLPVPCKALVKYQIAEGLEPVVLRIEVKRLLENSKEKD